MGRDKAALPFGNETILERVIRRVREAVPEVRVSAAAGQEVPGGFVVVRDRDVGAGPLVALARALPEMPWDLTLVVACDMPLVEPRLLLALFEQIGGAEACVPTIDGVGRPTCAVYRSGAAARAAAALVAGGERRLQALTGRLVSVAPPLAALRAVDPDLRTFLQCNTPDEYRQALALAGVTPGVRP
jgi:molybdopterin-guanine dinucleotide biosynthesis protein A